MMKKWKVLLICVLVCGLLCGCGASKKVMEQIDAIGTVSLDSEARILEAEEAYNALSDRGKARVENYELLAAARKEWNRLAGIQEYLQFYGENEYTYKPKDYAEERLLDDNMVDAYEQALNRAVEAGVTVEDCPELEYAYLVVSLEEYREKEDFVQAVIIFNETCGTVNALLIFANASLNQGNLDYAKSFFSDALENVAEAQNFLKKCDGNDPDISVLMECLDAMEARIQLYLRVIDGASWKDEDDQSDRLNELSGQCSELFNEAWEYIDQVEEIRQKIVSLR